MQQAEHQVINLMRDINRAERFGESTRQANEARFRMDQKLMDITDRFIPFFLTWATGFFTLVETFLTGVDVVLKAQLQTGQMGVDVLEFILKAMAGPGGAAIDLRAIRNLFQTAIDDNKDTTMKAQWDKWIGAPLSAPAGMFQQPAGEIPPWSAIQMPPAMAPPPMPLMAAPTPQFRGSGCRSSPGMLLVAGRSLSGMPI
jgi:hypothetical protein